MGPNIFSQFKTSKVFVSFAAAAVLAANIGCSGSSASDGSTTSASTSSVLTVTPASPTIAPGGSVTFSVTGGTSPYYFALISAGEGYFSSNTYVAPSTITGTSLQVSAEVQDNAGNVTPIVITVSTSATSTLAISPTNPTVVPSGQIDFSATGGTPPYVFSVLTSGGGSFSGAIFTAPATVMDSVVEVTDSLGNTSITTVTVSNSSTSTASCEGTYNMNVEGGTATLSVIEDSSGTIAGNITNSSEVMSISGTCTINASGGSITFTDLTTNSKYTGTLYVNLGSGTNLLIYGTYTTSGGSTYNWSAAQQ